jgi:hypothetical protein
MEPQRKLLLSGILAIVVAVAILLELVLLYSPFQQAVEVVSPFIVIGILISVGTTNLLMASFLSGVSSEERTLAPPSWTHMLSVVATGFAITALLVAAVFPGPAGPPGSEPAFISGYAVITDCDTFPSVTSFRILYTNLGNSVASNVIAQFTLYALNNPVQIFSGTVSIGPVQGRTTGSVTQSASVGCGNYGSDVEVSFAWT